jgi:hypothetical protein
VESAQARIERISAEFGAKVQDVVKGLDEERAHHQETRERYEQELGASRRAPPSVEQSEQDQFSALAGLSRKFREDRERRMDIERRNGGDARTLHLDHARALRDRETVSGRGRGVEGRSRPHYSRGRGSGASAQDRSGEARVQIRESFEKTLRGHADELASLRQEHGKEVARRAATWKRSEARPRDQQALRDAVEAAKIDALGRSDRAREERRSLASQRREYEEEITAIKKRTGTPSPSSIRMRGRRSAGPKRSATAREKPPMDCVRKWRRWKPEIARAPLSPTRSTSPSAGRSRRIS